MSLHARAYNTPDVDVIGPIPVNCPQCDTALGRQIRITLESEWSASKRRGLPEALLACPGCRRLFVAALWLSIAAYAVDGQAA